jgi:hypothetical protein
MYVGATLNCVCTLWRCIGCCHERSIRFNGPRYLIVLKGRKGNVQPGQVGFSKLSAFISPDVFEVILTVHRRQYVEIKCQLDATDVFLLQILLLAQTCFGHHYAHHQEPEIIIQLVAACGLWCLVFKLSVWCGAEGCVSGRTGRLQARRRHTWPSAMNVS